MVVIPDHADQCGRTQHIAIVFVLFMYLLSMSSLCVCNLALIMYNPLSVCPYVIVHVCYFYYYLSNLIYYRYSLYSYKPLNSTVQ